MSLAKNFKAWTREELGDALLCVSQALPTNCLCGTISVFSQVHHPLPQTKLVRSGSPTLLQPIFNFTAWEPFTVGLSSGFFYQVGFKLLLSDFFALFFPSRSNLNLFVSS
jgi:hypothetical protein